jgi:predicted choloylglycine hydrolase
MKTFNKHYWFKRLPVLNSNAGLWVSHMAQYCNLDAFRLPKPTAEAEIHAHLQRYMPELLTEFEALLVASPKRPDAAQLLAMYNVPPFFAGCSVSVSHRRGHPTLIRNYDMGVNEFSGVFRYEELQGGGWIIGSAEGGWGYLDGMNHHGLAVAITFGGSFRVGEGFAVPIIVRCLLVTCATVPEALERLRAIPHQLVQNIYLLDASGRHSVAYTSPDGVTVADNLVCCTNHQRQVQDVNHAVNTRTVERFEYLFARGGSISAQDFLEPPLYNREFSNHFGTLYTLELNPVAKTAHYHWPGHEELFASPASRESELQIELNGQ